jgi:hypothetical protein
VNTVIGAVCGGGGTISVASEDATACASNQPDPFREEGEAEEN